MSARPAVPPVPATTRPTTTRSTLTRRTSARRAVRGLAVGSAALGLVALSAGSASAHVTATPSTTAAGAYGIVTIALAHGCNGSATTKVEVKLPEQVISVAPTLNDRWTITKKTEKLATPIDREGTTITQRTSEVVFTAKQPLADGYRDAFDLSLQLPDAPGSELSFPTIQTCEKGQTAWIEEPAPGQSHDDVEHPAPSFELTAADAAGGHGEDGASASPGTDGATGTTADPTTEAASAGGSNSSPVGWIGLGLGAVGAVLGGTALARTRKAA